MQSVHLTLMMGPTVAVPVPLPIAEAIDTVEVTHSDEGRSGFQIGFLVGRSGLGDVADDSLVANPLFKPFNRVVIVVTFDLMPSVLFDGHYLVDTLSVPAAFKARSQKDINDLLRGFLVRYPGPDSQHVRVVMGAGVFRAI